MNGGIAWRQTVQSSTVILGQSGQACIHSAMTDKPPLVFVLLASPNAKKEKQIIKAIEMYGEAAERT